MSQLRILPPGLFEGPRIKARFAFARPSDDELRALGDRLRDQGQRPVLWFQDGQWCAALSKTAPIHFTGATTCEALLNRLAWLARNP